MQQELIDIPTCTCGQPCTSYTYMTPNYDDGGSIDSFSPETIYLDECAQCVWDMQISDHDLLNRNTSNDLTDDELPF
jgi:hypothetical protein